jgi:hypothetical protein
LCNHFCFYVIEACLHAHIFIICRHAEAFHNKSLLLLSGNINCFAAITKLSHLAVAEFKCACKVRSDRHILNDLAYFFVGTLFNRLHTPKSCLFFMLFFHEASVFAVMSRDSAFFTE